jgi:uncharacterized membrane protein YedE/YeeE
MINPHKVKGFLNLFGEWDIALAFVMGGAVIFNLISYKFILNKKPFLEVKHFISEKVHIDKRLLIGSAMFGVGWGLIGICPGPGLVNLVTLKTPILIFIASMIAGMLMFKFTHKKGLL